MRKLITILVFISFISCHSEDKSKDINNDDSCGVTYHQLRGFDSILSVLDKRYSIPDTLPYKRAKSVITKAKDNSSIELDTTKDIVILPAKGDRLEFFFDGNSWSSEIINNNVKVCLHVFVSAVRGDKDVWIQRLDNNVEKFTKLMNFIDSLPRISVAGQDEEVTNNSNLLDAFFLYYVPEKSDEGIRMDNNPNKDLYIFYVQQKIKEFYKRSFK